MTMREHADRSIQEIADGEERRRKADIRSQLRMAESEVLRALARVERHLSEKLKEPRVDLKTFDDFALDLLQAQVHTAQATLYEVQAEAVLAGVVTAE